MERVWNSVSHVTRHRPPGLKKLYIRFVNWFEKYVIAFVLGGFLAGTFAAKSLPAFSGFVDWAISSFIDGYSFIAPMVIFLVLAPSLTRLFKTQTMGSFGLYVIWWLAVRKILACLWAVAFIAIVLRLPLTPEHSTSIQQAANQSLRYLISMALTSPYFWALYASAIVAVISLRVGFICNVLDAFLNGIEGYGRYLITTMPLFMVAVGAYVYGLPDKVPEQAGLGDGSESRLHSLSIWGWQLDPRGPSGMILTYVVGALLTAVACMLWQCLLLFMATRKEKRFTIRSYFRDYWVRVYPLLWATSSEALATPLNLYLVKRYAPYVRDSVRRFIVGIGSYMNINGTLINVIILGAIVLLMLGFEVSVIELLLLIPIVFFISYGVPGIPGELVLFAGPIAILLNLPPDLTPIFIAIYIGMQIGLSDSFRTGTNGTDNHIIAILMNKVYEEKFPAKEPAVARAREVVSALDAKG